MGTTTLQMIAGYLDARGWHYQLDQEQQRILTGVTTEHQKFMIVISLFPGKNALGIRFPEIGHAGEKRRLECLQTVLMLTYGMPFGGFGMDLRDGEIDFELNIPIDGAAISKEQFDEALGIACTAVDTGYTVLNTVMWSDKSPVEVILSMMGGGQTAV